MRILGMDYGSKTLGISLSDETKTLASPIETIKYKSKYKTITQVTENIIIFKLNVSCKSVLYML